MKKIILLISVAITWLSCGKSNDVIPNVAVNFQVAITDPRVSALNARGGVVLIGGYGVAGLLLYREADGSYACYDRCSSYQPQNVCAVTLDSGGFTVTDPCSGSKFSFLALRWLPSPRRAVSRMSVGRCPKRWPLWAT